MTTARISYYKIVVSGHIIEAMQYARPIGYSLLSSKKQSTYRARRTPDQQEITVSSLSRTRNKLIRLINANARMWKQNELIIQPQFLTYTFKENLQDVTLANMFFTNYVKRLNYQIFGSKNSIAKYVVVPEFQKRGAVHYHAVFFNLPAIDIGHEFKTGEFQKIWKQGFIKPKKINEIPNVGIYMTKYMTKDAHDRRLVGRKKYFSTRGLYKPEVISYEGKAVQIMDYLAELKPIHAYITKKTSTALYAPENPTFCATYNLTSEQLQVMKSFYTVDI